jgi:DNA-binding winged helix-turn-helix (wHTH) protein
MSPEHRRPTVISFNSFEADIRTQELKKHGVRLRLPGQSFLVLQILLQHPGELVTREELQQALWPSDTHVDFERGVNAAVNRLREVLGDSADNPRLIETLTRRGYRFIGTIVPPAATSDAGSGDRVPKTLPEEQSHGSGIDLAKASVWGLFGLACASLLLFSYYKIRSPVEFHPLVSVPFTDYPGFELCPAFSSDGSRIAFPWNGGSDSKAVDLYVRVIGSESLLRLTNHPSEGNLPGMVSGWYRDCISTLRNGR